MIKVGILFIIGYCLYMAYHSWKVYQGLKDMYGGVSPFGYWEIYLSSYDSE